MTITFSYFARSATVDLVSNDCHFPKLNSGNGCLCPKGMEFNSLGECVECALNYYSNSEFNSECRSCPYPRVTLQKGSSDLDHCVCPLNTLDSVDACLPCPHLAECGYGNLTGIEPGFMLNNVTWELDECDIWFNCEENSCKSPYSYGDLCQYCTDDSISTRIFCIGEEYYLFKVGKLVMLIFAIYLTDLSMLKFLELVQNHHDILLFSTSEFQRAQVLKSMSRFSNVLFITLISIPIILTKSASSVLVFFEFILSAFEFDIDSYFIVASSFQLFSFISSYFIFRKLKQFKFYHSAFLTTSALVSINFIFGTLHQHFLVSPQSLINFILLFIHCISVVFVLYLQRRTYHFVPSIVYILMVSSSFFTLPLYLIIQTILMLFMAANSVSIDRLIFAFLALLSVINVFKITQFS
ncbi:hypothetical protein GEMRC1_008475 [Eukaryota sp. GEM-RC1]